jgi:hypothetical protein
MTFLFGVVAGFVLGIGASYLLLVYAEGLLEEADASEVEPWTEPGKHNR